MSTPSQDPGSPSGGIGATLRFKCFGMDIPVVGGYHSGVTGSIGLESGFGIGPATYSWRSYTPPGFFDSGYHTGSTSINTGLGTDSDTFDAFVGLTLEEWVRIYDSPGDYPDGGRNGDPHIPVRKAFIWTRPKPGTSFLFLVESGTCFYQVEGTVPDSPVVIPNGFGILSDFDVPRFPWCDVILRAQNIGQPNVPYSIRANINGSVVGTPVVVQRHDSQLPPRPYVVDFTNGIAVSAGSGGTIDEPWANNENVGDNILYAGQDIVLDVHAQHFNIDAGKNFPMSLSFDKDPFTGLFTRTSLTTTPSFDTTITKKRAAPYFGPIPIPGPINYRDFLAGHRKWETGSFAVMGVSDAYRDSNRGFLRFASFDALTIGGPADNLDYGPASRDVTTGFETTVTTGANSDTQQLADTSGFDPGKLIHFATAGVNSTILSITDGTHLVLTASVNTTTGEAVQRILTTVTTGANSATQEVADTTDTKAGDVVHFDTANVNRQVQSVTDSTHFVLTAPVNSTTGEMVEGVRSISKNQTVNTESYRYLKIPVDPGVSSQAFQVEIREWLPPPTNESRKTWFLHAAAHGTTTDIVVDLCRPDAIVVGPSFTNEQAVSDHSDPRKQSSRWPVLTGSDRSVRSEKYWGCNTVTAIKITLPALTGTWDFGQWSFFQTDFKLSASRTDGFGSEAVDTGTFLIPSGHNNQRQILGIADGRYALEVPSVLKGVAQDGRGDLVPGQTQNFTDMATIASARGYDSTVSSVDNTLPYTSDEGCYIGPVIWEHGSDPVSQIDLAPGSTFKAQMLIDYLDAHPQHTTPISVSKEDGFRVSGMDYTPGGLPGPGPVVFSVFSPLVSCDVDPTTARWAMPSPYGDLQRSYWLTTKNNPDEHYIDPTGCYPRLVVIDGSPPRSGGGSLLRFKSGGYARAEGTPDGLVFRRWIQTSSSSPDIEAIVDPGDSWGFPCMALDEGEIIRIQSESSGTIQEWASTERGASWFADISASGYQPVIREGTNGSLWRARFKYDSGTSGPGTILISVQLRGDTTPGADQTFSDTAGTPISITDINDADFDFLKPIGPEMPFILTCTVDGDTGPSEYGLTDNVGLKWTRISP